MGLQYLSAFVIRLPYKQALYEVSLAFYSTQSAVLHRENHTVCIAFFHNHATDRCATCQTTKRVVITVFPVWLLGRSAQPRYRQGNTGIPSGATQVDTEPKQASINTDGWTAFIPAGIAIPALYNWPSLGRQPDLNLRTWTNDWVLQSLKSNYSEVLFRSFVMLLI